MHTLIMQNYNAHFQQNTLIKQLLPSPGNLISRILKDWIGEGPHCIWKQNINYLHT